MYKTIAFVLLFLSTALAQPGYGVKFGMLSSKQVFDFEGKTKHPLIAFEALYGNSERRLGPQIGLFVNFPSFRNFAIQSEISYLQKGAEERFEVTTVDNPEGTGEFYTIDLFQFDYLAFALLAQPRFKLGAVSPYGVVGPSLNWLIANRAAGFFGETKKLTTGLTLGLGFELSRPLSVPLLFEFRYNPDLTHFFENQYFRSKYQIVQILLGIKLK